MWKKIGIWILKYFLWPVLQSILEWVIKEVLRVLFVKIRVLFSKWQKAEQEEAESDEQRVHIRQKYEERVRDIEILKTEMSETVTDIVRQALRNAEAQRDRLIEKSSRQEFDKLPPSAESPEH